MREILFHGKRIDNGEWVEGFYLNYKNVVHYIIPCDYGGYESWTGDFYVHEWHRVDPATVGQYTGLTDKNGKKIFEGDILAHWNEDQNRYVAKCVAKYGEFNCSCCDGVYGWYLVNGDIRFVGEDGKYYEVIGNVHDNRELLEVDNGT